MRYIAYLVEKLLVSAGICFMQFVNVYEVFPEEIKRE
jgi:hypothetical protein